MLAKIACVIAALSVGVDAQFTNPIGSGPASGLGYMLMNTMPLPPIGNYSIGYLPAIGTIAGGAGGVTDMPACRRIQMFKFPALLSGIATMVTMNTLPSTSPEVCDVGFNLYTFSGNQQVGTTYIGAVSSIGSTTSGSPGNGPPTTGYEVSSTLNVSSAGWYMTNGTVYYLTIQPFTYNSIGGACNIRLPYGMDTTRPPRYAVVTQQGPIGQPCGVSPWTTVGAIDGGYIHMSIAGMPFTSASPSQTAYLRGSMTASPTPTSVGMKTSASPTGTVTPTGTGTVTPTSAGADLSGSDTPTGTDSPSASSSQTPTPSSSSSPSVSASSTVTPTQTSTGSQSQGMSISNTPTSAPAPVATASVSSSGKNISVPIDTPLAAGAAAAAASGASAPVSSIVGGVFAAVVVVAVIASVIAFNLSRTVRAQVGKYTGIKDARSPVTSSQSVIVMNPAGNAVSVYHNTM